MSKEIELKLKEGDKAPAFSVSTNGGGKVSLADLKGKRVSVGAAKSGTELNARAVLKAAGLSYADLAKTEYLPFGESVELIKNRQLDATLQSAGLGVASIRDALARQLYLPVQWTGCMEALAAAGATRVAECGPGKVLSGLARRIDKSLDARAIGTPDDFDSALGAWRQS